MDSEFDVIEQWEPWRTGVYEVSSLGRIRRVTATRITPAYHVLSQHVDRVTGYALLGLRFDGHRKTRLAHAVVAEAWIGLRPEGLTINHIDGNRTNNTVSNLEYITHGENVADGVRRSRERGIEAPGAKITADDVRAIRCARSSGTTLRDLVGVYGLHRTTITLITSRKTWRHIA